MELNTLPRTTLGKANKSVRKSGQIPAEFYGHGMRNETLAVDRKEFTKVFLAAGENTIVNLILNGKKQPCLVYDVQYDPVSGEIIHVDFYGVRMDEKLRTKVPVEFTGESAAVKELGGVLNKALSEIEVEALPADLPHSFSVDLAALTALNQSIYVKNIAIPPGVKLLIDTDTVVVTVTEPAPEEEAPPPTVDVSEVKVESEEKKEEREAEKEVLPDVQKT